MLNNAKRNTCARSGSGSRTGTYPMLTTTITPIAVNNNDNICHNIGDDNDNADIHIHDNDKHNGDNDGNRAHNSDISACSLPLCSRM